MGLMINGFTPGEYFRLKGALPIESQEKLIEQHADLLQLLYAAYEVADEVKQYAYQNHECFRTQRVVKFLKSVHGLNTLVKP